MRRTYVDGPVGQVHVTTAGDAGAPAVLLLHQTPRSAEEFRDVLALLAARGFRAVAPDHPGMGGSDPVPGEPAIEDYAAAAVAVLDALDLDRVGVVGHHTGGVVAVEVAARAPERVGTLVLSSTPYVDAERRARVAASRPPIDAVQERANGAHLVELWQRRQAFYPPDRPDLLHRFVADALRVGVGEVVEAGHRAVNAYRMEDRLGLVRAPVLAIAAPDDPFAWPARHRLVTALRAAGVPVTTAVLAGGMVPLPDQLPAAYAEAVATFLTPHLP